MAVFQAVIFQTLGGAGWSNVFYISAADHAGAMATLQILNTAMLATQSDGVFSLKLRVSNVEVKGDGLLADPTVNVGALVTAPGTPAPVNLAVHYEFHTADRLHRVHHYVHGIRQTDMTTLANAESEVTGVYAGLAAVAALETAIKTNTVNWQGRTIPPTTAPLTLGGIQIPVSVRRVGRPFGLFRGRRRIA